VRLLSVVELEMELEVSYNENYCVEGQVERRRGATDRDDRGGQAVGMACVDRHIFFITPLSSPRDADLPPRPP
jgi:hypothetical protein